MIILQLLIKWQQESMFDMETIPWKKVMHLFQVIQKKYSRKTERFSHRQLPFLQATITNNYV